MSIEVASQMFLFTPSVTPSLTDNGLWGPTEKHVETAQTQTTVPFSHNHLHDLESLWWVALWVVMYNNFLEPEATTSSDPPDRPPFQLTDVLRQLDLANNLFPPILTSRTQSFLTFRKNHDELPINKKHIYRSLNYLREILIRGYKDIEEGYPQSVDPTVLNSNIYEQLKDFFSRYSSEDSNYTLDFIPEIYITLSNPKRPRSESMTDTGAASKSQRK